ncbi:MAG: ADP-ribosylglycohydrolase family protein [Polyangiaceae bacterium]
MAILTSADRLARAKRSLEGLALGDALGDEYFLHPHVVDGLIAARATPSGTWRYTDDTVMAMSIVDVLEERGSIDEDRLAQLFAARYRLDPDRGYGGGAHRILSLIGAGQPWAVVARDAFGGEGSMGNGGAMRAAPIGAYFAGDLAEAADQARRSAIVTHAHLEGQAGAIAVAAAAAYIAVSDRPVSEPAVAARVAFDAVLAVTPPSATRQGLEAARELALDAAVDAATELLGNGSQIVSQDTAPFTVYSAIRHFVTGATFEEAFWYTLAGLGDRDTTCAIVCGILTASPHCTIPAAWHARRESLEVMAKSKLT